MSEATHRVVWTCADGFHPDAVVRVGPDDDAATTPPTPSLPHRDTAKVLAFAKAMYPEEFDDEGTPVGVMPSAERSDSTSPPYPLSGGGDERE